MLGASLAGVVLAEVDRVIRAELARKLQTQGHGIDDDHGRATFLGDGACIQAETARTLDDDVLASLDVGGIDRHQHLRQGAVGGGGFAVGYGVRHPEKELSRVDVVVGREGRAMEMRRRVLLHEVRECMLAVTGVSLQAGGAFHAIDRVDGDDAVSHPDRLPGAIGLEAIAQLDDAPDHLVAESTLPHHRMVAVEQVDFRSANVGLYHFQQGRPRLDLRGEIVFPNGDLSRLIHIGHASLHRLSLPGIALSRRRPEHRRIGTS